MNLCFPSVTRAARRVYGTLPAAGAVLVLLVPAWADEKLTLEEPVTDSRVFNIDSRLQVSGQLQAATGTDKALGMKLSATAVHQFSERRMPGTGRDAEALRSLRHYREALTQLEVDKERSSERLRDDRRLIVAQGQREGVVFYSPEGPLTGGELELLQGPGDSLALRALLPKTPVEVGQSWSPDSWAVQMLTRIEAVLKSELTCRLARVDGRLARVTFEGRIEGATLGAVTTVTLSGHYLYDLERRHIARVELEQKEKRSVGVVSPGMDVTAMLVVNRTPAAAPGPLTDAAVARIPLEPPASLLMLRFDSPWSVRFTHDRDWHVFFQSEQVAVLRLLDKGSLLAQCNLSPVPAAAPGRHLSEEKFQEDIRKVLGETLKRLVRAEQLKTDDGRFLYRVTAVGEVDIPGREQPLEMTWLYYLCAAPSGQQVSLVFAVETENLDQLGDRDLALVNSLEFLTPRQPATARP